MSKLYFIIVLLTATCMRSQTLNFEDINLKNALVNTLCVETTGNNLPDDDADTNNDGEIQHEEALAVTRLFLDNVSILSLDGIQQFPNLEYLYIQNTQITGLNVSGLESLQYLICNNNSLLTTMQLQNLTGLLMLDVSYNDLVTVDASQTTAYNFNFSGNANLSYINIKNGVQDECTVLLEQGYEYTCSMFLNLPSLQTVCVDDEDVTRYFSYAPQQNVQFVTNCPTNGLENLTALTIIVYPNPVHDMLTVSGTEKIESITLYNNLAQKVLSAHNTESLNTVSLNEGTYSVEVVTASGKSNRKIVKI